jgi:hypothetical protein
MTGYEANWGNSHERGHLAMDQWKIEEQYHLLLLLDQFFSCSE